MFGESKAEIVCARAFYMLVRMVKTAVDVECDDPDDNDDISNRKEVRLKKVWWDKGGVRGNNTINMSRSRSSSKNNNYLKNCVPREGVELPSSRPLSLPPSHSG